MSDAIVGLDIGTSNVRVVVAEFAENGELNITGVGSSSSNGGLKNGVIQNLEITQKAIQDAMDTAELMSGHEIKSCSAAIGGEKIQGINSNGLVSVTNNLRKSKEIDQSDIDRVIQAAQTVPISIDRQILHVCPQSFTVDGEKGIKDPLSMLGVRLETDVYIITVAATPVNNIVRSVTRAGYDVSGVMLKTLASARSIMTEDERNLGSILIDLGGGTTDVLVISDDAPLCTCSVPYGGQRITSDISVVKGIPVDVAERIKLNAGCCWERLLNDNETVIIPGIGGRPAEEIPRKELCRIIQARMEEIFCMARDKIALQSRSSQLAGGIVLCGAGALMPGVADLAAEVFDTTGVRIGRPTKMGDVIDSYRSPEFATAAGIVLSCADKYRKQIESGVINAPNTRAKDTDNFGQKLFDWIKGWF